MNKHVVLDLVLAITCFSVAVPGIPTLVENWDRGLVTVLIIAGELLFVVTGLCFARMAYEDWG